MSKLAATVSVLALSLGLLAACSKPAGGAGTASSASVANTPAPATAKDANGDVVIDVSQAPRPRPGAWEMTAKMSIPGMPASAAAAMAAHPVRICVADRPFQVDRHFKTHCKSFVFHRTPTGLAIDASCQENTGPTTMHMTVSGDFQSAYAMDSQVTMPIKPGQPPVTMTAHTTYRYVGACTPAEQAEADQNAAEAAKPGAG